MLRILQLITLTERAREAVDVFSNVIGNLSSQPIEEKVLDNIYFGDFDGTWKETDGPLTSLDIEPEFHVILVETMAEHTYQISTIAKLLIGKRRRKLKPISFSINIIRLLEDKKPSLRSARVVIGKGNTFTSIKPVEADTATIRITRKRLNSIL